MALLQLVARLLLLPLAVQVAPQLEAGRRPLMVAKGVPRIRAPPTRLHQTTPLLAL